MCWIAALPLALSLVQDPVLLADFDTSSIGPRDSDPSGTTAIGGDLWLIANDDPWRFDPATGTAAQLAETFEASGPAVPLGGGLGIQRLGTSGSFGRILVSDGTPEGSRFLLPDLLNQPRSAPFEWAGGVYLFAFDSGNGLSLWTTDGTDAGTQPVGQLPSSPFGAADVPFAISAGVLYVAQSSSSGLLAVAGPGSPPQEIGLLNNFVADLEQYVPFNGSLVFSGHVGSQGEEPWITDGTAAGTQRLIDAEPGAFGSDPRFIAADSNRFWFIARTSAEGRELWVSDGTSGGTRLVRDLAVGPKDGAQSPAFFAPGQAVAAILPGGDLLFGGTQDTSFGGIQENFELWRSDGTVSGTRLVADLLPGLFGAQPRGFVQLAGLVYFSAALPGEGREVLRTDGTPSGTRLAFDLNPGPDSADPWLWSELGSLWIAADSPQVGRELWSSDGTAAGTQLAFEFAPQTTGNGIDFGFDSLRFGDELLFAAESSSFGAELFATDGTPTGTRLVADLSPGIAGSGFIELAGVVGDRAFFAADVNGRRLFATDGTAAGTVALTDPALAESPKEFVRLGDQLLFATGNFFGPGELWRTDGTPGGTQFLADVKQNTVGQRGGLEDSAELDGFLYFHGRDAAGNAAVWRTDGTSAGTGQYATVPNNDFGEPFGFLRDADQLLFLGPPSDPADFHDLWSLDGTPGGAAPLFGVRFSIDRPEQAVRLGDGHVIGPNNDFYGAVWFTDGTQAGTQPVLAAPPSGGSAQVDNLFRLGDRVFFTAVGSGGLESELWSTDGTPAGTVQAPSNQQLGFDFPAKYDDLGSLREVIYVAYTMPFGLELWRHDPLSGAVARLTDLAPGAADSRPTGSAELNGRLIFDAFTPEVGRELWAIDLNALGVPSAEPSAAGASISAPEASLSLIGELAPGGSFELRLDHAPPVALSVALRSSPTAWTPLPGGGSTGLDVPAARIFAVQVTDGIGSASTTLTLPANPSITGLALEVQSVFVEPGGPLFGMLGATNGVDVVLGP